MKKRFKKKHYTDVYDGEWRRGYRYGLGTLLTKDGNIIY